MKDKKKKTSQANVFTSFAFRNKIIIFPIFFYFIIRTINLTELPIFNDESIYLNWGWQEIHQPDKLFYSLFDGKQPFLMWIFGIAQDFFSNPLWAGRFISVLTGFATFLGIYFLSIRFFNRTTAIIASLLYSIIPIFSFFDRQALMESSIAAIGVWAAYCFLSYVNSYKKRYVVNLGILLGIGYFIKSSITVYFLGMIPIFVILFLRQKSKRLLLLKDMLLILGISQFILLPLYSQAQFFETFSMNNRFVLTINELIHFPINIWFLNFKNQIEIIFWYFTPLVFLAVIIGFKNVFNDFKTLFFYLILIFSLVVLFTRNITPRYTMAFLPLLTIPSGLFIQKMIRRQKIVGIIVFVLCLVAPFYITVTQVTNPMVYFTTLNLFTKHSMRGEYVTDWMSGYGTAETVLLLDLLAQKEKGIYVGVRPDSGNPEDAMFVYFNASNRVHPMYIHGFFIKQWTNGKDCITASLPFYYVSRGTQMADLEVYIQKKIKIFQKPESAEYIGVYKLRTDCPQKS